MKAAVKKVATRVKTAAKKVGTFVKTKAKNLKEKVKGALIGKMKKMAAKFIPKWIREKAPWDMKQYNCFCSAYGGQIAAGGKSKQWAVVPGWRTKDHKDWVKRDSGPILFSMVRVPTSDVKTDKSGKVAIQTNKMDCQFDVSVYFTQCFKDKNYKPLCSQKGCKLGGDGSCKCPGATEEEYYRQNLQCRPNKASCNGGSMVGKDVKVKMVGGMHLDDCKRAFLSADALVRALTSITMAQGIEKNQRRPCEQMKVKRV